jgi:hypothetical protein
VRSRAATARAWAKQELTEAVVLETVGPVYGEPGVARHWDDPTRAAAEQAAAKTQSEGMIRHGDTRLANKAARAAARVAAARAARLIGGDGVSGDGHAQTFHYKNHFPPGDGSSRLRTDALRTNPTTDPSSRRVRARTRSAFAPAIRATTTRLASASRASPSPV